MLKRKIYDELVNWKNNKKNECLLINGARQVGKTFIVEKFGKDNYKSCISINLFKNPEYSLIFDGTLDPKEILKRITLQIPNSKIIKNDTLIFIDEIQKCPKARTALKFLSMCNELDVIASGSLLGLNYKSLNLKDENQISVPVGYERELKMYSLDFEEFLWGYGYSEDSVKELKDFFLENKKIPNSVNDRYQKILKEYLVVGGMPEVVKTFFETSDFNKVFSLQNKILTSYSYDIEQYASNSERLKIRACYSSIPRQLAKENTKFMYSFVSKGGNARKYENSLDWLIDAGLIDIVRNVSTPKIPLKAYENPNEFKIYGTDIGLVTSMFGKETQFLLAGGTLTGSAKGGIYENLIFDMLHKRGYNLSYYKKNEGMQEIEFVFEKDGCVIPIEVKSKRGETISLNEFICNFKPLYAYKLIEGNIGKNNTKITMPHYMAMFI